MIIENIILKFLFFILPLVKANNDNFIKCNKNINGNYFTNIDG